VRDEQELKTILDRIANHSRQEFGDSLREVILYGSYARGDQQPDSDIDVMVVVNGQPEDLRRSRRSFTGLTSDIDMEYGVFVSPVIESADTFDYWKEALPFFRNVDMEGVRLSA
jgi:predicted nucleotidyltransferase